MNKKMISILISIMLLFTMTSASADTLDTNEKLTLKEAIDIGLKNSIDLKKVENEIDLKELKKERAEYKSDKLEDAKDKLNENKRKLNRKEDQLEAAKSAIDNGILPEKATLPDGTVLPKGTNLNKLPPSLEPYKDTIVTNVESELDKSEDLLKEKKRELYSGELTFIDALDQAGDTLSEKLDYNSLDNFNVDSTSDLLSTMSNVSYEVAKASKSIYRNKIALLIEKSYYDALKAKKILEFKKKAMERGKKQFDFAKESYKEGMKAKDDMLLAKVYYKSTIIEYDKAMSEYKNALLKLKKNMNIDLDKDIKLAEVSINEREVPDLDTGLEKGLNNRLEIKKSLGEVAVYNLNFKKTKKKYPDITFQYREAKLLEKKAKINYEKTLVDVKSSIRKSYETYLSTKSMLKNAKGMVESTKESLEIAEFKYKEGFGTENSLLKSMDLESSSGTIVEVLACEEKLAEVEEKVIEITHGYNLAKMNYYNNIGKNIY
ncbi:MAG: TolC family protein [Firmicutes bacterium]|nr:TolC family protein [Bacillota bacterium]